MPTAIFALDPFAAVTREAVRAVVTIPVVGVGVAEGGGSYRARGSNGGTSDISGGADRSPIPISMVAVMDLLRHCRGGNHGAKQRQPRQEA
jgi:hypothetical protein